MEQYLSWPEYYKERFPTKEAIADYLAIKRKTRDALFLAIKKHIGPPYKKLLEAGCGTSSASIILNQDGYTNTALDQDQEMLAIGKRLNQIMGTNVEYRTGDIFDLEFEDDEFDGIFSHGVIEHFNEDEVVQIVNEGIRVACKYILSFPTILNRSSELRGDENPWTYFHWKRTLEQSDGKIERVYSMYSKRPIREAINVAFNRRLTWTAPNLVFVISK
jgi:SAM-dependent methyltransferase